MSPELSSSVDEVTGLVPLAHQPRDQFTLGEFADVLEFVQPHFRLAVEPFARSLDAARDES